MYERETDDPCCYLLAIWSPGEVPSSIPNLDDCNHEDNPFATSSFANEADSIKGTLLVPCRTAMQGSFPLNGTYFQVNEVPISLNSCRFFFLQIAKRGSLVFSSEVQLIFLSTF
jgi:hypothetical protein